MIDLQQPKCLTWRFAGLGPSPRPRCRLRRRRTCRSVRAIALIVLPQTTIRTVDPRLARRRHIVLLYHIAYYAQDPVIPETDPPAKISDSVVYTALTGVTLALHGIST